MAQCASLIDALLAHAALQGVPHSGMRRHAIRYNAVVASPSLPDPASRVPRATLRAHRAHKYH